MTKGDGKGPKPKGRPEAPIDAEHLKKLAERQWSVVEIAAFFGVSHDTIERRFAEEIAASRHRGCAKIRDLQWKRAMEGSDRIIIHMSEQYLGQTRKMDIAAKISGGYGIIERVGEGNKTVGEAILYKTEDEP
jgi:AraC-like DNA-binding protein